MVGYQQNDTLTTNQKLLVGCISGAVTRFVTQPLEVLKLKAQIQRKDIPNPHRKWFKNTRRMFMEEKTLKAFWKGHNVGQINSIIQTSSQFYVYELATAMFANSQLSKNYEYSTSFVCGLIAGCCSCTIINPLEVIKVRQMLTKKQYKGLIRGARTVYRSGGLIAFSEGWTASMLMVGPSSAITFGVFSYCQNLILRELHGECDELCMHASGNATNLQSLMIASSVAAFASGVISKGLTYPLDMAKKRLQVKSHVPITAKKADEIFKCNRLISCLTEAVQREGIKGLFRGFKITMYKSVLTSVVSFSSYELLCFGFREYQGKCKRRPFP